LSKPTISIRWSITQAAAEFAIDRQTLHKRLVSLALDPEPDGKFTTAQITAAVFGNLAGEKLGKAKADRITAEVNAAHAMGDAILAADASQLWADAVTRTRTTIEHADYLSDSQKERLLGEFAKIKLE
jgi:hypothetical protein